MNQAQADEAGLALLVGYCRQIFQMIRPSHCTSFNPRAFDLALAQVGKSLFCLIVDPTDPSKVMYPPAIRGALSSHAQNLANAGVELKENVAQVMLTSRSGEDSLFLQSRTRVKKSLTDLLRFVKTALIPANMTSDAQRRTEGGSSGAEDDNEELVAALITGRAHRSSVENRAAFFQSGSGGSAEGADPGSLGVARTRRRSHSDSGPKVVEQKRKEARDEEARRMSKSSPRSKGTTRQKRKDRTGKRGKKKAVISAEDMEELTAMKKKLEQKLAANDEASQGVGGSEVGWLDSVGTDVEEDEGGSLARLDSLIAETQKDVRKEKMEVELQNVSKGPTRLNVQNKTGPYGTVSLATMNKGSSQSTVFVTPPSVEARRLSAKKPRSQSTLNITRRRSLSDPKKHQKISKNARDRGDGGGGAKSLQRVISPSGTVRLYRSSMSADGSSEGEVERVTMPDNVAWARPKGGSAISWRRSLNLADLDVSGADTDDLLGTAHVNEQGRRAPRKDIACTLDNDEWSTRPDDIPQWVDDPELKEPGNEPLITRCDGWHIEVGRRGFSVENALTAFNVMLEYEDKYIHYYADCMSSVEQELYVAVDLDGSPVIAAVETGKSSRKVYKGIVFSNLGQNRYLFTASSGKGKERLKHLQLGYPPIKDLSFSRLKDTQGVVQKLVAMEQRSIETQHKFGVLYVKEGQVAEEDMFSNHGGSPLFYEFLECLGKRVRLKGWPCFRGGLDIKRDSTGTHSVYTEFEGLEIMFHVSTMLPYSETDTQQLSRKRHIGNDVVVIAFVDGTQSFNPESMKSHFPHVYAVVQPEVTPEGTYYRIAFASKDGVRPHLPHLPHPCRLLESKDARRFLLTKLINAERSAMYANAFATKLRKTRSTLLKALIKDIGK